ncbi:MAG: hypothetical protein WEC75_10985 [Dehalococcoidia bacterium]
MRRSAVVLRWFTLIVAFMALPAVLGCAGDGPRDASSPLEGLLTDVRADDADRVIGVTVLADDGDTFEFEVDLEPGASVSATHLLEHVSEGWPVRVSFHRVEGGTLLAYRIDDGATPVPTAEVDDR